MATYTHAHMTEIVRDANGTATGALVDSVETGAEGLLGFAIWIAAHTTRSTKSKPGAIVEQGDLT